MAISDRNRDRFEGIGADLIRRDLATGRSSYVGRRDKDRQEAKDWVALQDGANRSRTTMVIGLRAFGVAVGIVAVLASILSLLR